MKRITQLFIVCTILLLFSGKGYAQRAMQIKEKGPMFITTASFSHGFVRIPYAPLEGEDTYETEILKQGLPSVSLSQFFGFQFNPYLALGVGLGFDYWTKKNAFVPLYVDFRVTMLQGTFAPQWYVNLGYANRWHIDSKPYKAKAGNSGDYIIHGAKSGLMAETGIGVKVSVKYNTALIISAFAKFQESSLRYYGGLANPSQTIKPLLVDTDQPCMYISLGVRAGVIF